MLILFNFYIAFLILKLPYIKSLDSFPEGLKLIKTIVLFRHGMRAPLSGFPFDSAVRYEEYLWPEGYGTLVTEGKNQMFKLGQQLRSRYLNLLKPYNKSVVEDIRIVTTAVDRCYMSAALMLAGFYPPEDDKWDNKLLWQPVPILSTSPDKIHIIGHRERCELFHAELLNIYEIIKNESNFRYITNYILNYTLPMKINTPSGLFMLADYFVTKKSLGLTLPQWADEDFTRRLNEYYIETFSYLTKTDKMRRLITGPLINDIIRRIRDSIYNESTNSKFYFYSGHDSSLHTLLKTMGFEVEFVPSYGACILIEVYRSPSNGHFIKLLYSNNYSLQNVEVKVLPKCEKFCSVGQFVKIFDEFIHQDWKQDCKGQA